MDGKPLSAGRRLANKMPAPRIGRSLRAYGLLSALGGAKELADVVLETAGLPEDAGHGLVFKVVVQRNEDAVGSALLGGYTFVRFCLLLK